MVYLNNAHVTLLITFSVNALFISSATEDMRFRAPCEGRGGRGREGGREREREREREGINNSILMAKGQVYDKTTQTK